MAAKRPQKRELKLNFQFVSKARPTGFRDRNRAGEVSYKGEIKQVQYTIANFGRVVLEDFALSYSDAKFEEAKRALAKDIERIVTNEVERMASAIGRGLHRPDDSDGPWGRLRIVGDKMSVRNAGKGEVLSDQAEERGWQSTWDRSQSQIKWAKRSPSYMRRKKKAGLANYWFKGTGELANWLKAKSSGYYFRAFGPVSVRFEQVKEDRLKLGTPSGLRGGQGTWTKTGKLTVNYFGKITPQMMPGLSSFDPNSNPLPHPGVATLLPKTKQRAKLLKKSFDRETITRKKFIFGEQSGTKRNGKPQFRYYTQKTTQTKTGMAQHRPAIDPFVSFYMTRAIPNAIWRRTERIIQAR